MDLGFLGQGNPNYSEAYGVNDLTHVVGNSAVGSAIHGFLWRNGQMTDLGVGDAKAINNTGLIAGRSILNPVIWEYDITNPNRAPRMRQLPIPSGFFTAVSTAVNDSGDVVGYAGSPSIDAHAILWRNGQAIDLGVWPGGHYSIANGINNLGQIVGTGTVAGDNLDHALVWTVGGGIPCGDVLSFQARCQSNGSAHRLQAKLTLTDTSHSGEQATITVDGGDPIRVTINGNQAQLSVNNPAPGQHTIVLTDPAGCFPPRVPSCQ